MTCFYDHVFIAVCWCFCHVGLGTIRLELKAGCHRGSDENLQTMR